MNTSKLIRRGAGRRSISAVAAITSSNSFGKSAPWRLAASLATALTLAACAHKMPPPTDQLADARASIAQAESAGALQLAPLELRSAREKLVRADSAVRTEKYREARALAEESQADAVLAERKARAAKAEATAAELMRSNQQLNTEAQRNAQP